MSTDLAILCYAVRDVLCKLIGIREGSRDIGCTTEFILMNPHTLINFVFMAEHDPSLLRRFRADLTAAMKNESGS